MPTKSAFVCRRSHRSTTRLTSKSAGLASCVKANDVIAMTPAAYERWRVRIPPAAIAAVCWVLLIGPVQHQVAEYCSAGFRVSLDRLSSAARFYPPAYLAWEWGLMVAAMMVPM